MRFSAKVFSAIAAVGAAGALAGSLLVYRGARDLFVRDYEHDYRIRLALLTKDFAAQEGTYRQLALNAARVVRELDAKNRGRWTTRGLHELAGELGVENIKLSDATGAFVASGDGNLAGNLFALCGDYRKLLGGGSPMQTPLIPDVRNPGQVAAFTMVPTLDQKRVIDVSVHIEELARMLQRVVDDESDINHVVLRGPGGQVLGEAGAAGAAEATISATVPSDSGNADCCECRARGLEAGKGGYGYELTVDVSGATLLKSMADLLSRFSLVAGILLVLALSLAAWLSRALVARLHSIRGAVDRIAATKDFGHAIPVREGSRDELDSLATHFNEMFASMRSAQAELLEAKKAEARSAIAAQVSHDIRSPLTSMTLALNRLKASLPPGAVQGPAAEMLSVLSHGISRVSGIVQRLARGAGKAAEAVEVPRLTLVDKLFFDVAQEAALKLPQRLAIEGFAAIPEVWAVAQVTELQTALSNVLNNAAEASAPGTVIRVSCREGAGELTLEVQDQGAGIPEEIIGRVFEREFTSGKAGGSGLGLYQAKKALEWCGGKISIRSKPGEGTSVTFTIPVEKRPAWCVDEVRVPAGGTLVVADDDAQILEEWRKKAGERRVLTYSYIGELDRALPSLGALDRLAFVLDQHASDGGGGLTGTAFLEKHGLGPNAVLSTSEYDDPGIQDKLRKLKAKMIPKPRLAAARVVTGDSR